MAGQGAIFGVISRLKRSSVTFQRQLLREPLEAAASGCRPVRPNLLLHDLDRLRMILLVLNLRGIPTSAQSLNQVNRGHHLLAK